MGSTIPMQVVLGYINQWRKAQPTMGGTIPYASDLCI